MQTRPGQKWKGTLYWVLLLIDGNIISYKSKKQSVVAQSNPKAKYCTIAHGACKQLCLRNVLKEICNRCYYDFKLWQYKYTTALCIISNHMYHERPKHNEVYHFIHDEVMKKGINLENRCSQNQVTDFSQWKFQKGSCLMLYASRTSPSRYACTSLRETVERYSATDL